MAPVEVSIVTIFLNAGKFLPEAIESVLAQTFRGWELLLVNDGSSDGSVAVAQAYAHRYPDKIKFLEHAAGCNLGKSASRNLGLRHAVGRYVAFLDADDVLMPDKLERQVRILEANPGAAMVYGRTQYWHAWTGAPDHRQRDFISDLGVEAGRLFAPPLLMTRFLRNGGTVPCLCALVARRSVIEELGGFDESIQQLYEDQVLIAKICTAKEVYVEAGVGERYRQHADSSSAAAIRMSLYHPRQPNPARGQFLSWLAAYFEETNLGDRALRRALRRELRPYHYRTVYHWQRLKARLASGAKAFLRGRDMEGEIAWRP
jgi:glycosyltransferase involved in cell wall biosynthesis